jgi:hypothetical protein
MNHRIDDREARSIMPAYSSMYIYKYSYAHHHYFLIAMMYEIEATYVEC